MPPKAKKVDQTQFRVVRLPERLREAAKAVRAKQEVTLREFVAAAVKANLPTIVEGLQKLGLVVEKGPTRPARLPFLDEDQTLPTLKAASEAVGVPATRLLVSCLAAAARQSGKPATGKRRNSKKGARS